MNQSKSEETKSIIIDNDEYSDYSQKPQKRASKILNENLSKKSSFSKKNPKSEKQILSEKDPEYKIGNYLIQRTLGQGTFGKVKLGLYIPNNEKVAIKVLEKYKMTEKEDQIRVKREFDMLSKFNHPNVIMVTEIFESTDSYYTVMEYCEGGELFNYIVEKRHLSEKESSFFYYQLINGLEYIHSLNIVHRDLKPENLLLTEDLLLKIIDFGLSNYYKNGDLLSTPCGSPCYASPEMVSGKSYNGFKIDIWSTGIILYAMLCGYLPFEDKNNDELFQKILECNIDYPDYLSNCAKDLLKKILVTDPEKRINIPEIKEHPFYIKGKNLFEEEFTIQQITINPDNKDKNNEVSVTSVEEIKLENINKQNYKENNLSKKEIDDKKDNKNDDVLSKNENKSDKKNNKSNIKNKENDKNENNFNKENKDLKIEDESKKENENINANLNKNVSNSKNKKKNSFSGNITNNLLKIPKESINLETNDTPSSNNNEENKKKIKQKNYKKINPNKKQNSNHTTRSKTNSTNLNMNQNIKNLKNNIKITERKTNPQISKENKILMDIKSSINQPTSITNFTVNNINYNVNISLENTKEKKIYSTSNSNIKNKRSVSNNSKYQSKINSNNDVNNNIKIQNYLINNYGIIRHNNQNKNETDYNISKYINNNDTNSKKNNRILISQIADKKNKSFRLKHNIKNNLVNKLNPKRKTIGSSRRIDINSHSKNKIKNNEINIENNYNSIYNTHNKKNYKKIRDKKIINNNNNNLINQNRTENIIINNINNISLAKISNTVTKSKSKSKSKTKQKKIQLSSNNNKNNNFINKNDNNKNNNNDQMKFSLNQRSLDFDINPNIFQTEPTNKINNKNTNNNINIINNKDGNIINITKSIKNISSTVEKKSSKIIIDSKKFNNGLNKYNTNNLPRLKNCKMSPTEDMRHCTNKILGNNNFNSFLNSSQKSQLVTIRNTVIYFNMYDPNLLLFENSKRNISKKKSPSNNCRKINNVPVKDSSNCMNKLNENENVIKTIENNSRYHDIIHYRKLLLNSKKTDTFNNLQNRSANKNLIIAGVKNIKNVKFFKKKSKSKARSKSNTKELRYSNKNANKLNITETLSSIGVTKMYIKNIKKINKEEDYMIKSQINTNLNNNNINSSKTIENRKHMKFNSMRLTDTNKNNLKEIQSKEKGITLQKKPNISKYKEYLNAEISNNSALKNKNTISINSLQQHITTISTIGGNGKQLTNNMTTLKDKDKNPSSVKIIKKKVKKPDNKNKIKSICLKENK